MTILLQKYHISIEIGISQRKNALSLLHTYNVLDRGWIVDHTGTKPGLRFPDSGASFCR